MLVGSEGEPQLLRARDTAVENFKLQGRNKVKTHLDFHFDTTTVLKSCWTGTAEPIACMSACGHCPLSGTGLLEPEAGWDPRTKLTLFKRKACVRSWERRTER